MNQKQNGMNLARVQCPSYIPIANAFQIPLILNTLMDNIFAHFLKTVEYV